MVIIRDLDEWVKGFLATIARPKDVKDYIYLILSIVPMGCVVTYKALGQLTGRHPRSIARLMRYNQYPILIPCHRVVSATGIGGFSLGVEFKKRLLEIEEALADKKRRRRGSYFNCIIRSVDEFWKRIEYSDPS